MKSEGVTPASTVDEPAALLKTKKKRFTAEMILMLIFIIFFLIMLFINIAYCRYIHYLNLFLFLLPSAFFFTLYRIKQKHDLKKIIVIISNLSISLISVVLLFFNFSFMLLDDSTLPVRDTNKYQKSLTQYGYPANPIMAHFPQSIPTGAESVRFYELPAFWQGGSSFILKFKTNSIEIENIYSGYTAISEAYMKSISGSDDENLALITSRFSYDEIGYDGLPDDFDLLILDSQPSHEGNWNHGYTYGIAVSRMRMEVIYWSKEW